MEIYGNEITECLAEDMLPGHYYLSEDSNRNIVLPLDTEGNVVIFSKEFRYYDSYEKTTCEKCGIHRVRELEECCLAWVRVWASDFNYALTALPVGPKPPKRYETILNWQEAFTTMIDHYGILHLSDLCMLSIQDGCIHLDWMYYENGGLVSELGKVGYLKEWYTPDESKNIGSRMIFENFRIFEISHHTP